MRIKGKEVLIDTNILVFSSNTLSDKYKIALSFRSLANNRYFNPIIAHQNILETIRVLTHPKFENPFNFDRALKQIQSFENLCRVIYPNSEALEIFKKLTSKYKVTSNRIFDCYLVATMLSNGIKIIATDNVKDLSIFEEIEVYSPYLDIEYN